MISVLIHAKEANETYEITKNIIKLSGDYKGPHSWPNFATEP